MATALSRNRSEETRIRPLIKVVQQAKTLRYKPHAALMGRAGVGKTTLANAVCGTRHPSGAGSGSITRELFLNDVSCGTYPFALIDTPGTDSTSEAYKHAFLLKTALITTTLNTIFIIIKYENRFDKMLENYYEVQQMVDKYEHKIVVMVSHWDLSKDPNSHFKLISREFEGYCSNMIFYSETSSNAEIANLMYSCIANMVPEKLEISDTHFIMNFNVTEIKLRMKKSLDQYRKQSDAIFTDYQSALNDVGQASVQDRDEILHLLIVEFKNELEQLLKEFQEKHRMDMQEIDYYTFYVKMERENVKKCDSFVQIATEMMSYNLFDSGDPRNLIKQCPHCELIWFKTEGCDGLTNCGNNEFENYFDLSSKTFWKYRLTRKEGKLKWTKNGLEKKPLAEPSAKKTSKSKRMGCGGEFRWSALPKLDDELIFEIFKVKTMEQAKQLIKDGNFQDARRSYERSIDSSFHQ